MTKVKVGSEKEEVDGIFYYVRARTILDMAKGWRGVPVATVCLLKNDDGSFARGVALCGEKDTPDKKLGRHISAARARKSQKIKQYIAAPRLHDLERFERTRLGLVVHEILEVLENVHCNSSLIATNDANLTDYEKKLVEKAARRTNKNVEATAQ